MLVFLVFLATLGRFDFRVINSGPRYGDGTARSWDSCCPCPSRPHPTQARGPASRFHRSVIYFLPGISDLKTAFCICVQDNKFPEDKDYIL